MSENKRENMELEDSKLDNVTGGFFVADDLPEFIEVKYNDSCSMFEVKEPKPKAYGEVCFCCRYYFVNKYCTKRPKNNNH